MTGVDKFTPASRHFYSKGLKLHYVDWGNPGAPTLLLVHGARDHCRSWDGIAAALRHDWHVIALDMRGHGDSEHAQDGWYTVESFIYDLAEAIDQLTQKPVTIVGHSMGGIVSVRYAGIYPEKVNRLVCIEGMGIPPDVEEARALVPATEKMAHWIDHQRSIAASQPRHYASFDQAANRMMEENPLLTMERARQLTEYGSVRNGDGTYSWKFDRHMRVIAPTDLRRDEIRALWENISCPVLFIYSQETWASYAAFAEDLRYFEHHELVLFGNSGHWVHHDNEAAVIDAIRRFMT